MSFKALLRLCSPAPAFATHRLHGGPVNLNGACHLSTAACVARHPVREWSSQSPKQGLSVPQRSTVEPCIATMCRRSRCDSPLAAVSGPSVHRQTKAMAQNKVVEEKEARKAAKRQAKAEKRAKREGTLASGSKECDLCGESKDLLIRCTVDETQAWRMVCTSCWKGVSGGVVDGDNNHPHYRYGGMWKNKSASSTVQSAKKPR